jgi:hypothetical protein
MDPPREAAAEDISAEKASDIISIQREIVDVIEWLQVGEILVEKYDDKYERHFYDQIMFELFILRPHFSETALLQGLRGSAICLKGCSMWPFH